MIRTPVIGIWSMSCVQGIYVFESVSWKVGWKVSCVQGIYMFESVSWKQTLHHEDRHRNERPRVTSAVEDKSIRVTSLRNCSPNKCFTEFK